MNTDVYNLPQDCLATVASNPLYNAGRLHSISDIVICHIISPTYPPSFTINDAVWKSPRYLRSCAWFIRSVCCLTLICSSGVTSSESMSMYCTDES